MTADATTGTAVGTATTRPSARRLAALGLLGPAIASVLVGALHVMPDTAGISPYSRTISEYALTDDAWAFNLGVVALALGSLLILVAPVLAGLTRTRSIGFALGLAWVAALLIVVVFPKHNWAVGPSANGQIHRAASLVAFLCLPPAVMLLTRRRISGGNPAARCAFWLAAASLGWFAPLATAALLSPVTGTPWYRAVPIGLVERSLVVFEVAAVVAVGIWVLSATRRDPASPPANLARTAPVV